MPRWRRDTLTDHTDDFASPADAVEFAHASERQFARLLDFYGIDWEYEPRTFPIEFDDSGNPTRSFTPDFYLPDEDTFIEITTMNQKLVTKKNRKVRLLRERYPDVDCKILPAGLPPSADQVRPRAGGGRFGSGSDPHSRTAAGAQSGRTGRSRVARRFRIAEPVASVS